MATNPSLIIVPYRYKAAKLYSQLPESGAGDFTVTRSTTATRTNASGLLESVASGVPRLDYTGGGCPALLVEPAATNQIRNSTNVGAASGTPGTLPTNWTIPAAAGLTREIIGIGTENGINYIDVKLSGTATGTETEIRFETTTQIVAANAQIWTESLYLKTISSPNPPLSYRLFMIERTAGGTTVATGLSSTLSLTTSLNRFSFTRTLSGGVTVERVQPSLFIALTNGASYDFTIRIGLPQMELGAVATSVIPTSGTTQTRNADVISVSSVSGLIGQTQGTIYAEVDLQANTAERRIISVTSGVDAQRIIIWTLGTTLFVTFNAATSINLGAFPIGTLKIAVGYTISGGSTTYSISRNGTAVTTGTSAAAPTGLTQINLGSSPGSVLQLNDRIRAAAIYTSRLSNAELETLTTL